MQLYLYFRFELVREADKVLFTIIFMRGKAQRWVKPSIKKYEDGDDDDGDLAVIIT